MKKYLPMSHEQYKNKWVEESDSFNRQSCYSWMSSQLDNLDLVLEIGCGNGNSTLSILEKKPNVKIIVIEDNKFLIKEAQNKLTRNGIEFDISTNINTALDLLSFKNRVIFINDNIFNISYRKNIFDGIVCWLIGASPFTIAESYNIDIETIDPTNNILADYRKDIHKKCYELGLDILKNDGFIHFVDRGAIPSWNVKDDARKESVEEHKFLSKGNYEITKNNTILKKLESLNMDYKASAQAAHNYTLVLFSIKSYITF